MDVRSLFLIGVAGSLIACAKHKPDDGTGETDASMQPAPCTDSLGCFIVDCAAKDLPPTSISGTIYAPNGTLPLYGVNVYVPVTTPGPFTEGAQCDRCSAGVLGGAYAQTKTDEAGHFVLENIPATSDVPIVVQTGKWRRQFTVPVVAACQDLPIDPQQSRLPKNKSEGDIPQIAITTGNADALECLPRKLGIDDAEFTTNTGVGRVHLYDGNGADHFQAGNVALTRARDLWDTTDALKKYDMVFLSCEGGQNTGDKPQTAIDAMVAYANLGGRVFASHWHNVWLAGHRDNYDADTGNDKPLTNASWSSLATYDFGASQDEATQLAVIDETVPTGPSFAKWLDNVGATPTHGQLSIADPRYIIQNIDPRAERWVYFEPTLTTPLNKTGTQDFVFTTPIEDEPVNRCGKVVFSDMHVSKGSVSYGEKNADDDPTPTPFPSGCSTGDLTPQEKALAFIFFDIASCVGSIQ